MGPYVLSLHPIRRRRQLTMYCIDFFTRELQDGYRETASPDDDSVIANACESKPFNVQRNVKLVDEFWTKGNKYSLSDMMAGDSLALECVELP
jgi:phosphatidylserine decarboxylase